MPKIAVFSGPSSTVANSPPLVTSNKARLPSERKIPGQYDHLVPQLLFNPVTVRIRKYTAHPLEQDASDVYFDDGNEYYEVTLRPEDGPYLLPYMARRADGSEKGAPFEANDLSNAMINYGKRQFFYPDASRIFVEIDRTISGRNELGEGSNLGRKAEYEFFRVLPPGGYTRKGEISGVDYFPYWPEALAKTVRARDLARIVNIVQRIMDSGIYSGGIWLENSSTLEETLYWMNLTIDTKLPIVGVASQRPHGELSNDGDRNLVDAVDYVLSDRTRGIGVVAVIDQQVFAARDFKKSDDRPGNYKATGGHGGILGQVKASSVTIWYRPNYKHTDSSELNFRKLPTTLEFSNSIHDGELISIKVKDDDGSLRAECIPRVRIIKYGSYMQEDETENPDQEVEIMAAINKATLDENSEDLSKPKLHGLVYEGVCPYATGARAQMKALCIAALSGIPVVRVGRSDPGGRVVTDPSDLTIEGSNLDANKARILLIAAMLKLGRLPRAKDPRNPTSLETEATIQRIQFFQNIFEEH